MILYMKNPFLVGGVFVGSVVIGTGAYIVIQNNTTPNTSVTQDITMPTSTNTWVTFPGPDKSWSPQVDTRTRAS